MDKIKLDHVILNMVNYWKEPKEDDFALYLASALYFRPDKEDREAQDKYNDYWKDALEDGHRIYKYLNDKYKVLSLSAFYSTNMELTLIIEVGNDLLLGHGISGSGENVKFNDDSAEREFYGVLAEGAWGECMPDIAFHGVECVKIIISEVY